MSDSFQLKVLTPGGLIVNQTVSSATLPGSEGEIGILPDHCVYVGLLKEGALHYVSGSAHKTVQLAPGSVQFLDNVLTVLVDSARTDGSSSL